MNLGQIYYAASDNRAFLKLAGVIRYPLSQRLNLAVGRMFAKSSVRGVVVDLQEADSTCMGLLARVATQCLELACDRPVIVSVQPEVNRLLRSMGFDQVFVLIEDPSAPTAGLTNAAQLAGISTRPDPKVVLDAHRALSEINENNRHLFQNVIEQLESDAEADASSQPLTSKPASL
jgi:anti-anti-sigma regulatory factor